MTRAVLIQAFLAGSAMFLAGNAAGQAPAKADLARGQKIAAETCAACHAADGNSTLPANPKLAGQFPEYLHRQLANFKAQGGKKAERDNAVMGGMVAALDDAQMRDLAAWYASQKLKPAVARDKNVVEQGRRLWRGGNLSTGVAACAGCHGPAGAGIPGQYPRIAGQHAEYVEAQLKAFRAAARANDPNGMMRGVAARMTDAEIHAVAEYAAGLR